MNAPILSSLKINLPTEAGKLETFVLSEPRAYPDKAKGAFNRVAFSAAHVVADARAANDPWLDCALDWEHDAALPRVPLGPRPRRGGGHGHGPARHGPRLADLARADHSAR